MARRLIRASSVITSEAFSGSEEIEVLLDKAEQLIFSISERRKVSSYSAMKDILLKTLEQIEFLYANKGAVTGIETGFTELDEMTSGFHPAELIILAARPSVGKSTLAMNMACNAAIRGGVPVGVFNLEMSNEQVVQRLLCSEAGVNAHRLRTGYLTEDDWRRISKALGRLGDTEIYLDDTPNISIMELRSKARRMKAEHNIQFLIIDYLQLMHTQGRTENRQQEISSISRSLKALARELELPVLALSQLSRAVEQRQDRRPMLSDLRESGAIEQDADMVAFIYHNPEAELESLMEIIVAKQRNGPIGSVPLIFLKEIGKFVNADRLRKAQETPGQAG